ncbi:Transposon TX1 uncharacterized 82 kDa protein [Anthophora plagiata]
MEGIGIKEYVNTLGKIIGLNSIRFISRIANNRTCVYLHSKDTVTELINKHPSVNINEKSLSIRPLVTPEKPIIISNVSPSIPYETIEKILIKNNVRITSKLTFMRAGLHDPGSAHILSFRRQIYINPDDSYKIPDSFLVTYEETNYRIFASIEILKCFNCNQEGHIAITCPKSMEITEKHQHSEFPDLDTPPLPNPTISIPITYIQTHIAEETDAILENRDNITTGNKRVLTSSSSPVSLKDICTTNSKCTKPFSKLLYKKKPNFETPRKRPKHTKPSEMTINDKIEPIKKIINNLKCNYPLNATQLTSILENLPGKGNICETAREYTKDLRSLISMLAEIHPLLEGKSLKK